MTLTSIYNKEIPEYLKVFLDTDAMNRLKGVGMNCGVDYTSLPLYKNDHFYSRYEHSLNVALILEHFTHDSKQVLSGLFHDMSTPPFAHTFDFLNGDYLKQESYENLNEKVIKSDSKIMDFLKSVDFLLKDVSDYKIYPLADNESPKLSADRLEYTLSNGYYYRFIEADDIKRIYDDLSITTNEDGIQEFCFQDPNIAIQFTDLALRCGKVYSSKESRYAMETLANLLKKCINEKIITENDIQFDDNYILVILENSKYKDELLKFKDLKKVDIYREKQENSLVVDAKKRYIDPLILNIGRVSDYSAIIKDEIHAYLSEDYTKQYLKGE